jgi:dsDNA-specific endonuclease/ATPase MutS2
VADLTDTLASEASSVQQETNEVDELRRVVGDVYTFVRSREINKTIASFTLDHYIDERKRAIKGERIIRSAANPGDGIDRRLAQLDAISKLEDAFNKSFDKLTKLAETASSKAS